MGKSRVPMQVAPEFEKKIKEIQKEIMKRDGKVLSLRDITEKIARGELLDKVEKKIANKDIRLNFDRRKR